MRVNAVYVVSDGGRRYRNLLTDTKRPHRLARRAGARFVGTCAVLGREATVADIYLMKGRRDRGGGKGAGIRAPSGSGFARQPISAPVRELL